MEINTYAYEHYRQNFLQCGFFLTTCNVDGLISSPLVHI